MHPKSIQRFDMLYLGSLAVATVGFFVGYDDSLAQLQTAFAGSGIEIGGAALAFGFGFGMAISLLLWWLISSKGSVVAKWILVVLTALSVLGTVFGIQTLLANFTIATVLSLLATVMAIVAIYFLFQPDTKPWFGESDNS
jgi:hypothetical protein